MFLKYFCKRSFKVHVGTTLKDPTESNDFTLWCNVNFPVSISNRKWTVFGTGSWLFKKRLDAFLCVFISLETSGMYLFGIQFDQGYFMRYLFTSGRNLNRGWYKMYQ